MKPSTFAKFGKSSIAKSVTAGLLMLSATQANAVTFEWGNISGSIDSTFSYGESWRTENRNWDTIGKSNNLRNNIDWSNGGPEQGDIWLLGEGSYSTNGDLGNLNYDSGEAFSRMFKGSHELDIQYSADWGDIGFFGRGMYFYDFEMMDGERPYTHPVTGKTMDPCDDDDAKEEVCRDVRLLDAFVFADFYIGDTPVSIRIGDQVIGWGESTLISHGISEINPVDIAALRAPGSELKEAFIPFGAIWASFGVTENFNIEAFYQYRWEKTVLPAPGSYFSTNDFAGSGGHLNNVQLGFGGLVDRNLEQFISELNGIGDRLRAGDLTAVGDYTGMLTNQGLKGNGSRGENTPDDGGQYGLKFSYFFPELNDTELALYYINYHSRRPTFSGISANLDPTAVGADIGMISEGAITEDNYLDLNLFGKAYLNYKEDIKLYGLSFNTAIGLTSVAGEVSYREDEPLQIDDVELLFAAIPDQALRAVGTPEVLRLSQMPYQLPQMNGDVESRNIQGHIELDTVQYQTTLTHLFGPSLGAGQMVGLFEIGGINILDMPGHDELRLNGPATDRSGSSRTIMEAVQDGPETNPFPDDFAWGYKVLVKLDYSDAFWSLNVSPRIVFSHDVEGITPDPLFLFVEERKSISLGLTFDYQSTMSFDINYNSFFDGVGTTNQLEDRDFVSFNFKYSI
ncbi:DUF1302 domain-containing protein [Thalassotalea crassostreae]|uniref:DUF1302 domain-containing protein n=1 Tax=Thalassotalea crassostreae TaxID=1763536 RepID=UPI000837DAE8|nr:DUF1302 domain-containing protein [Thalassotalea crassostreae]